MKPRRQPDTHEEPVGIVISSGSRAEEAPRFVAYVWGVAPELDPAEAEAMVAA